MNHWTPQLLNVVERAAQYLGSFAIPLASARAALRVGDFAKVCLIHPLATGGEEGERLWAVIRHVEGGRYRGEFQNTPLVFTTLDYGDRIDFGPEHVLDWRRG